MRKKTLFWLAAALFVLGAAAFGVGWSQFRGNAVTEECELFVGSCATYGELTDSLMPRLRHRAAFRRYARRLDLENAFRPGHYVLRPGMSVVEVARMLKLGLQTPVRIAVNNVRTPEQLARKLARQIDADSAAIMRALASKELAAEVGFDTLTLFSMFIPDTYEVWWTVSPEEFVRRMKREYDRFWTPERDALRARSGLVAARGDDPRLDRL